MPTVGAIGRVVNCDLLNSAVLSHPHHTHPHIRRTRGSGIVPSTPIGLLSLFVLSALCLSCIGVGLGVGVEALPLGGGGGGSSVEASPYDSLGTSLVREYLKIIDKIRAHPKAISGQVNLRAPRSELLGDMGHALRLYQLQELDRTFGSKSRPRFGKRGGEVIGQNDLPTYGSRVNGGGGGGGGGSYDPYYDIRALGAALAAGQQPDTDRDRDALLEKRRRR